MTAPSPERDIEARILHVEQRLVAREARLRAGAQDLAGRLRQSLQPRRLLLPAGSIVLGVAALLALRRRPAATPPSPILAGALLDIPWLRVLGLAWPLLPSRWRQRVSPATASSVVTLGLPLVEGLLSRRRARSLPTMAEVDLSRLAGRWFLVGELPLPLQAEPLQPPELGLLARGEAEFELLQRRIDAHGTHGSEARVQVVPGSHGARLRFSHWPETLHFLPWAWIERAVLHVDDAYEEALIGSADRESLWLLSRRPTLAEERRQALVQIARERGFGVDGLRFFGAP
ncbi:apolipoprotein D and lipocalin family protein [Pelomonas saccharophila]|uniref:Apolipoprotein D and lipocalin family protein n=1 Tax=Roseateles saccharophilus TaxID=304 RepID=A0ABU1YIG2_ROSSA|nr:lipocalin family protein [Roseateles saccharophilus]MDR7268642.1 apolipoprotein D and lipocalin family protein [Roseateles saccharophilus]